MPKITARTHDCLAHYRILPTLSIISSAEVIISAGLGPGFDRTRIVPTIVLSLIAHQNRI